MLLLISALNRCIASLVGELLLLVSSSLDKLILDLEVDLELEYYIV